MLKPRSYILWLWSLLSLLNAKAQDIDYAKQCIKTLCSDDFAGRGYINEGDKKAAAFIKDEFAAHKLIPLGNQYYQGFGFPVVIYPDRVFLNIDNYELTPGEDFIINPGCPAISGNYKVLRLDSAMVDNSLEFKKWTKKNLKGTFLIVDEIKGKKLIHQERLTAILNNEIKARGLIYDNQENLVWGVAINFESYPILHIKKGILPRLVLKLKLTVDASRIPHSTQNVIGMIKGSVQPDSFIFITAHYDHLGMMGKEAMFPGANDNASGVAMLLDLARHYSQQPPEMSIVFIAFAAEEAGLIGSYYYTENPLLPLSKISLVVNLDLMATGDKGLTAVNGLIHPELFSLLQLSNTRGNYLPDIAARGKAMNSDHFHFTENNVPALFFYLRGEYHHYHDVGDKANAITLSKYNEAFKLMRDFINSRMKLEF
ncbi:MAG: M28 family peptidase [Bacteroidetes bacterium]|jgi:aminopeptidase YwaD|nr:M28 family peptidase [Bacteroidota bacterium]